MSFLADVTTWLFGSSSNDAHIPDTTNYMKGVAFEKYVIGLFDSKYFALNEWTRDISGKTNGYVVESDANPDLVMRYKPSNTYIAIECKFRSSLYHGALQWTSEKKLNGYMAYANRTKYPTYVVIGLGGLSDVPERLFCIPVAGVRYPVLSPSVFEGFERDPAKRFFWDGHVLK